MPKKKPTKPAAELGPLARTILEIEKGPRCSTCGRSTRRSGHECKKA